MPRSSLRLFPFVFFLRYYQEQSGLSEKYTNSSGSAPSLGEAQYVPLGHRLSSKTRLQSMFSSSLSSRCVSRHTRTLTVYLPEPLHVSPCSPPHTHTPSEKGVRFFFFFSSFFPLWHCIHAEHPSLLLRQLYWLLPETNPRMGPLCVCNTDLHAAACAFMLYCSLHDSSDGEKHDDNGEEEEEEEEEEESFEWFASNSSSPRSSTQSFTAHDSVRQRAYSGGGGGEVARTLSGPPGSRQRRGGGNGGNGRPASFHAGSSSSRSAWDDPAVIASYDRLRHHRPQRGRWHNGRRVTREVHGMDRHNLEEGPSIVPAPMLASTWGSTARFRANSGMDDVVEQRHVDHAMHIMPAHHDMASRLASVRAGSVKRELLCSPSVDVACSLFLTQGNLSCGGVFVTTSLCLCVSVCVYGRVCLRCRLEDLSSCLTHAHTHTRTHAHTHARTHTHPVLDRSEINILIK